MTASDGFWYESEIWTDANLCVLQKSQEKTVIVPKNNLNTSHPSPKFNQQVHQSG